MNSTRLFRPFARAALRQPVMARPSVMARPALAAAQSKKTEVAPQQMVRPFPCTEPRTEDANGQQTILKSAMPQLIPFFFVNETTMAFVLLPTLIYIMSKYILPQRVRLFAARLFISKL
jgi:F-type H+-transporting ATPase subunit 8